MFDKVSQAAEKLATGMSRRGFLGSVGRWAGAVALGLAGVLTTAGSTRAGTVWTCCHYINIAGYQCAATRCLHGVVACPPAYGGCYPRATTVDHCFRCLG
jgi:hypothetical protein